MSLFCYPNYHLGIGNLAVSGRPPKPESTLEA